MSLAAFAYSHPSRPISTGCFGTLSLSTLLVVDRPVRSIAHIAGGRVIARPWLLPPSQSVFFQPLVWSVRRTSHTPQLYELLAQYAEGFSIHHRGKTGLIGDAECSWPTQWKGSSDIAEKDVLAECIPQSTTRLQTQRDTKL